MRAEVSPRVLFEKSLKGWTDDEALSQAGRSTVGTSVPDERGAGSMFREVKVCSS